MNKLLLGQVCITIATERSVKVYIQLNLEHPQGHKICSINQCVRIFRSHLSAIATYISSSG